jgi:hypothetical protein
MRKLGIPTVLDRFIQQAVLQVLQPIFDPTFSERSYGLQIRPTVFAPSGRGDVLTTLSCKRNASSRTAVASWWMWTWSNSSTA